MRTEREFLADISAAINFHKEKQETQNYFVMSHLLSFQNWPNLVSFKFFLQKIAEICPLNTMTWQSVHWPNQNPHQGPNYAYQQSTLGNNQLKIIITSPNPKHSPQPQQIESASSYVGLPHEGAASTAVIDYQKQMHQRCFTTSQ